MKSSYLRLNTLLILFSCLILSQSCRKDYDMELDKGNTPLALSSNHSSLVLVEKNSTADAFVFNWTSGSNYGSNASISYEFLIDKQGNDFKNAVKENMGKAQYTKKYAVKEFNDLLVNNLKLTPGVEATLEAKIVTTISGKPAPADSSTIIIKATPYLAVTQTLYLIGDASPNGWDAAKATMLTQNPSTPGKFSWTGQLKRGEYKFITTPGQFLPSYNKGAGPSSLVYRTADAQPDDKFMVNDPGVYTMSISLLDLSISVTKASTPAYSQLWVVGDATPAGWDISNPSPMRVDSADLFVFSYNEVLKPGEFKIPVAKGNFSTDYFMPLTNHPPLSATTVQLVPGGNPDYKWQITAAGPYKIQLNTQTNTISIKPFTPYTQMYMVGDATPNGWDIDNPNTLAPTAGNPYEFVYTGAMKVGEFKFPVAKGNWGTDFFMPVIHGSTIGSTQMKFVTGGNPDHKWKITQAGNYRITMNQLYETISIEKL